MSLPRLALALEAAALPEGRIAAFRPKGDADLSMLPKERVVAVQGFRPDHDALAARGYAATPEAEGAFAAAVIFVPRARAEARALVAEAAARVAPGGPVWVDGQKTDGVESLMREVKARLPVGDPIAKAHGRVFLFASPGPELFADWTAAPMSPAPGFATLPGVFSAEAVDRGSALLAAALPQHLPPRVADLGAGWGWLAAQILARDGVEELHLIEAEHAALACARRNLADPRARFHWADATRFAPERRFDAVVMNPPFHAGRAAEPRLGEGFIRAAAGMLAPSGRLWMVANRHLPYERALAEAFREVAEAEGGDAGFKILTAARPAAPGRKGRVA